VHHNIFMHIYIYIYPRGLLTCTMTLSRCTNMRSAPATHLLAVALPVAWSGATISEQALLAGVPRRHVACSVQHRNCGHTAVARPSYGAMYASDAAYWSLQIPATFQGCLRRCRHGNRRGCGESPMHVLISCALICASQICAPSCMSRFDQTLKARTGTHGGCHCVTTFHA
jgi:hypothetical protein